MQEDRRAANRRVKERKRRIAHWVGCIGAGLAAVSFATCLGVNSRGKDIGVLSAVSALALLTVVGFLLLIGGFLSAWFWKKDD